MKRSMTAILTASLLLTAGLTAGVALGDTAAAPTVAPVPTAAPGEDPAITARAREWFVRLQKDDLDRAQLTADMNAALTPDKAAQLASQIGPAGAPTSYVFLGETARQGYSIYQYQVACPSIAFVFTFVLDQTGKVAGMFVKPA